MKKLINNYRKWNPSSYARILLMTMPFLMYLLIDFKLDNDFWFLINTGKTIISDGFISVETFTIHSGLSFIPQQWLTDIIFTIIYSKFDIRGMFFLVIICNIVILYLSYKLCFLVSNSRKKSILITIFIDTFLIASGILATRPQLFDIIVFLLELYLLESYVIKGNKKYLYFLPLISLFLINAHASMWLMLFVFTIPYIVEYVIKKYKKEESFNIKPLLIVIIVSLLIGIINPYGLDSIKYLMNSYGVKEINILVNEMKPITIIDLFGLIIYVLIFILLLSFYKNKGKNKIRYFLLSIGVIYLVLNHYKAVIYLVILFPLILGYNFKNNKNEIKSKVLLYEKIVYCFLIVLSIILTSMCTKLDYNVNIIEIADYLDHNANFDIKLFTDYNNGGYMEYRGYKCYIDQRAEVFLKNNNHKEDIFSEYYKLETDTLNPKEFLEKYNFDYLLIDKKIEGLFRELLNNDKYKEVYSKVIDDSTNEKIYLFEHISDNKK